VKQIFITTKAHPPELSVAQEQALVCGKRSQARLSLTLLIFKKKLFCYKVSSTNHLVTF
jgi:hypothetical protein